MSQTKTFDTVKTFRAIKEKISRDITDMNAEQIKEYLRSKQLTAFLLSCSNNKMQSGSGDQTKETFSIRGLVKEDKIIPDSIIAALNAQHHQLRVLERRTVPGPFKAPAMKYYSDYATTLDKLPVINPGPGEYVHVMEGQRNGYKNLTIRYNRNISRWGATNAFS